MTLANAINMVEESRFYTVGQPGRGFLKTMEYCTLLRGVQAFFLLRMQLNFFPLWTFFTHCGIRIFHRDIWEGKIL